MSALVTQSQSTRKASTSREDRVAKRREKFALVPGFESVPVEGLGGDAALVESVKSGGYAVEWMDENGYAHAVPVEAIAALGLLADPHDQGAPQD